MTTYNVKNTTPSGAPGASGDGTTNDWDAFQLYLKQIDSDGGGELYIPKGKYVLMPTSDFSNPHQFLITQCTILRGEGSDNSILMFTPPAGVVGTAGIVVQRQKVFSIDADGNQVIASKTPQYSVIRDLAVVYEAPPMTGNSSLLDADELVTPSPQANLSGIILYSPSVSIENCQVFQFIHDGIHINSDVGFDVIDLSPPAASIAASSICEVGTGSSFIQGTVFLDVNNDGVFQLGEPGLQGVMITLTTPVGAIFSAKTDQNGQYEFKDLAAGSYQLTFPDSQDVNQTTSLGVDSQDAATLSVGVGGASTTSSTQPPFSYQFRGLSSSWQVTNCLVSGNRRHGIFVTGGDAGVGCAANTSLTDNFRWGIYEQGTIGNLYMNCNAASNGRLGTTEDVGNFTSTKGGTATHMFLACHGEGGVSNFVAPTIVLGGYHGAGITQKGSVANLTVVESGFAQLGGVVALGSAPQNLNGPLPDGSVSLDPTESISLVDAGNSGVDPVTQKPIPLIVRLPLLGAPDDMDGFHLRIYTVKNITSKDKGNPVIVTGEHGVLTIPPSPVVVQSIDDSTSYTLFHNDWITVAADGSDPVWRVISAGPTAVPSGE